MKKPSQGAHIIFQTKAGNIRTGIYDQPKDEVYLLVKDSGEYHTRSYDFKSVALWLPADETLGLLKQAKLLVNTI